MKSQILILCFISLLVLSCGRRNNSATNDSQITADTTMKFVSDDTGKEVHRVSIKSAVIHMKSSAMGMTQQIVIYLDDFGKKNATEVTQEMMGKKIQQFSISDGEYMYSFSPDNRKGKKSKLDSESPDNINFNALTKEMASKFKLKKTGTAMVLGRKCDVFTMEFAEAKLKGTYYIWKGIPLKTESEVSIMKVSMEATSIEENVAIDPARFEIPKDIVFDEIATRGK